MQYRFQQPSQLLSFYLILLLLRPEKNYGQLRGNYGSITDLSAAVSATEAASRVSTMANDFGIYDFQFYDVLPSYTVPSTSQRKMPPQWRAMLDSEHNRSACWNGESWLPDYMRRRSVCRSTLDAHVSAIHAAGGRAWLYVQALASDLENDISGWPPRPASWIHLVDGTHAHQDSLFWCYLPTADWGERKAAAVANVARALGFDGIHWDTLGPNPCGGGRAISADDNLYMASGGFGDFLAASAAVLGKHSLEQTANFVQGWGFNSSWALEIPDRGVGARFRRPEVKYMRNPNASKSSDATTATGALVNFSYWECWDDACVDRFVNRSRCVDRQCDLGCCPPYNNGAAPDGVLMYYTNDTKKLLERWRLASTFGASYGAIVDGARFLHAPYFPDNIVLPPSVGKAIEADVDGCAAAGALPPTPCHTCNATENASCRDA